MDDELDEGARGRGALHAVAVVVERLVVRQPVVLVLEAVCVRRLEVRALRVAVVDTELEQVTGLCGHVLCRDVDAEMASEYVLRELGADVPFFLDPRPARVTGIGERVEPAQGVPEEVWALDLPNVFPAYQAVYVGVDGAVWVRRWPPATGDQTVFDVFTREGEFQHTVVLNRSILVEPTPFLSESAVIGVTRDPFTDESIILRFDEAGE